MGGLMFYVQPATKALLITAAKELQNELRCSYCDYKWNASAIVRRNHSH